MKVRQLIGLGAVLLLFGTYPAHSLPAPSGTGVDTFPHTVDQGISTLDAISRLIAAIEARHQSAARASDPSHGPFADVANTDRAYAAMTKLEEHNLLRGYPAGYFRGKRLLTRYEFAVGIKRLIDSSNLRANPLPDKNSVVEADSAGAAPKPLLREDVLLVSELVEEFDPELRALGMDLREVRRRLGTLLANH